ncbi:beta-hydroxyacid dehydrogenase [Streptomyces sulfonofaciens]|uniref:Beta-hydroxyacid dehydrogenase n=1 Tax=Streptomyces sulfonofaciens TaxID=68272 RepID=A0A919L081_9ACTN|nr:NAD(P)-dependent oxidoreductase [Streptomyces sulfonofaciens]GHH79242.1 beta-hydroxyacid dehydrogenase [Streptomyces sulfonofaciens]
MKIAFLGLGRMGRELAAHLVADGHDVTVWNRTSSATVPLIDQGAHAAVTAYDAVDGADAVVTALFGPDAVRQVVVEGELPLAPGALWIDVTTISPADATSFHTWATEQGVDYVHAPVIGSLAPARARKLGVLFGGTPGAVARAQEIVVWADGAKVKTYETAGKAAAAKLIANMTVALGIQGVVEALRLGHSNDLDTDEILSTLDLTMLAGMRALKGDVISAGTFDDTQFSADLLAKDIRLMLHSSQYALPAVAATFESLQTAVRAGRGDDDFSVIAAGDAR